MKPLLPADIEAYLLRDRASLARDRQTAWVETLLADAQRHVGFASVMPRLIHSLRSDIILRETAHLKDAFALSTRLHAVRIAVAHMALCGHFRNIWPWLKRTVITKIRMDNSEPRTSLRQEVILAAHLINVDLPRADHQYLADTLDPLFRLMLDMTQRFDRKLQRRAIAQSIEGPFEYRLQYKKKDADVEKEKKKLLPGLDNDKFDDNDDGEGPPIRMYDPTRFEYKTQKRTEAAKTRRAHSAAEKDLLKFFYAAFRFTESDNAKAVMDADLYEQIRTNYFDIFQSSAEIKQTSPPAPVSFNAFKHLLDTAFDDVDGPGAFIDAFMDAFSRPTALQQTVAASDDDTLLEYIFLRAELCWKKILQPQLQENHAAGQNQPLADVARFVRSIANVLLLSVVARNPIAVGSPGDPDKMTEELYNAVEYTYDTSNVLCTLMGRCVVCGKRRAQLLCSRRRILYCSPDCEQQDKLRPTGGHDAYCSLGKYYNLFYAINNNARTRDVMAASVFQQLFDEQAPLVPWRPRLTQPK